MNIQVMKEKKQDQKKHQLSRSEFAKYSTIAYQMILIILVGVFGGMQLDKLVKWEFPVFTFVLSILSVLFAIYHAIKDLIRNT